MKIIARANGSPIFLTENMRGYSLFNSPYESHRNLEAIDIVPNGDFGDEALSPVEGIVERVLKFRVPSLVSFFKIMDLDSRDFEKNCYEYVILIRDKYNKKNIFKILHVYPNVKEGEVIHVNDCIGYYIRTGYYSFWAACHLHLEVKDERNPLRARCGYKIEPIISHEEISERYIEKDFVEIRRKVYKITDSYIEVEGFYKGKYAYAFCENKPCILDGGIPHIGYGGVISNHHINPGEYVYFLGLKIGRIIKSYGRIAIFEPYLRVYVNGIEMRGISFIINLIGINRNRIVYKKREKPFINNREVFVGFLNR